ncbi:MAG: transposase [Bryobacteraceae bacterium]
MDRKRRRYRRYPESVRETAMERMRLGVNISALADELGVHRSTLYEWKERLVEGGADGSAPAARRETLSDVPRDGRELRIQELEAKVAGLEAELGRSAQEVRFFRGALRKIEESRRSSEGTGGTASTQKSGRGCDRKAD